MTVRRCKSSLITKLIILAVMILATATIVTLQPKITALRAEKEAVSREIRVLVRKNAGLHNDIDALGTDASVIKIARERLRYAFEGENIYIHTSK